MSFSFLFNNYYFSSFFWNTFQKVLAAIVGFVTVPLLLGLYGKGQYGILSLATACNGYMHLLDMGMNVGAVRFFSLWRSQGDSERINRVARTNITFYGIIAIINSLLLLALAVWGEALFSVSHDEFFQLRSCLVIIASFCIVSWGATTFNQLLVADKQINYTSKVQCVLTILKLVLIWITLRFNLSLIFYFLIFTAVVSLSIIPYIYKCKKDKLIENIKPARYWKDFRVVFAFSLSIFALSLFQITATQTRPIILGIFAENGTDVNAEYRILEVIPLFVIMIAGSFASVFLPKTTEIVSKGSKLEMKQFAYRWTALTTIITNILCFPFILGASDILSAYVGEQYAYLSFWLIVWLTCTIINMHNSPSYALVMAYGKTKLLVYVSCIASLASVIINAFLAKRIGVGSAVVGYWVYVIIMMGVYYLYYYNRYFNLSRKRLLKAFIVPTSLGLLSMLLVVLLCKNIELKLVTDYSRFDSFLLFLMKTVLWFIFFFVMLFSFGIVRSKSHKLYTLYD